MELEVKDMSLTVNWQESLLKSWMTTPKLIPEDGPARTPKKGCSYQHMLISGSRGHGKDRGKGRGHDKGRGHSNDRGHGNDRVTVLIENIIKVKKRQDLPVVM